MTIANGDARRAAAGGARLLLGLVGLGLWFAACVIPERTYDASLSAGIDGAAGATADNDQNSGRDTVDAGGGTEAMPPTQSLCDQYCDNLFAAGRCTESNRVYESVEQCRAVCEELPMGNAGDVSGNTVNCRLGKLNAAGSFEGPECDNLGALTQDGVCGNPCEVFCALQRSVCGQRAEAYCASMCPVLNQASTYRATAFDPADTLQCRFGHLAKALESTGVERDTECAFAQLMLSRDAPCRDSLETTPVENDRALYCKVIQASCVGNDAAYESESQCVAASEAFVRGSINDLEDNTLRCRLYHSYFSFGPAKAMHCRHAGPSGDGTCADPANQTQGICESYCQLLGQNCEDQIQALEDEAGGCIESCLTLSGFDVGDFAAPPAYSVNTELPTGSLECRMLHAVRAAAGNLDSCELAISETAECPGTPLQ